MCKRKQNVPSALMDRLSEISFVDQSCNDSSFELDEREGIVYIHSISDGSFKGAFPKADIERIVSFVRQLEMETVKAPQAEERVLKTDPVGAEVWVNGERVGTTPLSMRGFTSGEFPLIVGLVRDGYDPKFLTFRSSDDIPGDAVNLSPMKTFLRIFTREEVNSFVYLDGKLIGNTPMEYQVSPGMHEVVFRKNDYVEKSVTMSISAGETKDVSAEMISVRMKEMTSDYERYRRYSLISSGVFGAISLCALGTSIYSWKKRDDYYDKYRKSVDQSDLDRYYEKVKEQDLVYDISTYTLIGSSVLAVASITSYIYFAVSIPEDSGVKIDLKPGGFEFTWNF